jgi:hypothetical protein
VHAKVSYVAATVGLRRIVRGNQVAIPFSPGKIAVRRSGVRVAMQVLRHAQFAITMEIYTQVSSEATRDALKRLGERLEAR